MNKLYLILLASISFVFLGCNASKENVNDDYSTTWVEVKQKGNEYALVDCGYKGELLKIDGNSIFEGGIMEDNIASIDHVKTEGDSIFLFTDKNEKSYYNLKWIDKEKGLGKWTIKDADLPYSQYRYYCDSAKMSKYRKLKGSDSDCLTTEEMDEEYGPGQGGLDQNKWLGEYIFAKSITRSDSKDSITYVFEVSEDNVSIKSYEGDKLLSEAKENFTISGDSLIIRYNKTKDYFEDEYVIINVDDYFLIAGSSIYMLNPPNSEYPIKKVK